MLAILSASCLMHGHFKTIKSGLPGPLDAALARADSETGKQLSTMQEAFQRQAAVKEDLEAELDRMQQDFQVWTPICWTSSRRQGCPLYLQCFDHSCGLTVQGTPAMSTLCSANSRLDDTVWDVASTSSSATRAVLDNVQFRSMSLLCAHRTI